MKYQQLKTGEKYKRGDIYVSDWFSGLILVMKDANCVVERDNISVKKLSSLFTERDTALGHKSFRKTTK